jgi:hypothetical protein
LTSKNIDNLDIPLIIESTGRFGRKMDSMEEVINKKFENDMDFDVFDGVWEIIFALCPDDKVGKQ